MKIIRIGTGIVIAVLLLISHSSPLSAQYYHVTGRATDTRGAAIWGVDIDVEDSITGLPLDIANDHTDPNGDYDIVLPVGTFDIEYKVPAGLKLVSEIRRNVTISTDIVINIVFEDGFYLSGHVTDNLGAGIAQVDVDVDDVATGLRIITPRDNTDASGNYLVVVPSGLFDVTYEPPPGIRLAALTRYGVTISGDTVIDVSLESGFFVSGWVADEGGSGIEDVDLDVKVLDTGESIPTPRDNTDVSGFYSIVVPAGTFSILFDPLMRNDLAAERIDSVVISADVTLDTVYLPVGVILSGSITDWLGREVADADLDVIDRALSRTLPTPGDNSDSTGRYEVTVPPGQYDLKVAPPPGSGLTEGFYPSVVIAHDTTVDFVLGDVTGIGDGRDPDANPIPKGFSLDQNYPNPFNPRTSVRFTLPEDVPGDGEKRDQITTLLEIYDVRGRRIRRLVDRQLPPGSYEVVWDGRDQAGQPVGSGLYIYRLTCGPYRAARKMIVLK